MPPFQIIVVEDSASDALFIELALEELELNLSVAWIKDGEEAMAFFFGADAQLDFTATKLVLLDINLPRYTGLEVLQRLKKTPKTAAIPVVVFSSSEMQKEVEACLAAGAEQYVVKSIDLEDYTEAIKKVVRRKFL